MAEQILTAPQLSASPPGQGRIDVTSPEDLAAQADRITALHNAIWESPDACLDAVSYLGNIGLGEDDSLPESYTAAPAHLGQILRAYLSQPRDVQRTIFDPESEEAIYGNTEVRRRLASHTKLKVDHMPIGGNKTTPVDRPGAVSHRDQLSAYKLYLFIGRVRAYQEQMGSHNGGQAAA